MTIKQIILETSALAIAVIWLAACLVLLNAVMDSPGFIDLWTR